MFTAAHVHLLWKYEPESQLYNTRKVLEPDGFELGISPTRFYFFTKLKNLHVSLIKVTYTLFTCG